MSLAQEGLLYQFYGEEIEYKSIEMFFSIVFHRELHYCVILLSVAGCLLPNVLRLHIGLICKNQLV